MPYILFKNKKKPVKAQAKKLNKHQIEIAGCAVNASGFSYYQDADMKKKYGDYYDFTTVYEELDESFILSNDGSVHPDPPTPEPPEPTLKEQVKALEAELTDTQVALADSYEHSLQLENDLVNTEIAVTELYEIIIGGEE